MSKEVDRRGYPRKRYLPYRGQTEPKYINRGKQFRNLLAENRERTKTSIVLGLLNLSVWVGSIISYNLDNMAAFFILMSIAIVLLVLTIAITQGAKAINKFRPGYDLDVSAEKDHQKNSEEE
jgi:hypothetical protein